MTTPTKPTAAVNANTEETNANTEETNVNTKKADTKVADHGLHITWDEETIALHDKERGTRMKIDEPKTPYHTFSGDGEASPARSLSGKEEAAPIEWNELQVKLAHVETKQQEKSEWDSSDDEGASAAASSPAGARFAERDAEGKKIEKDPQFAAKRKSHYNEFEAVKMWRQSHADEDDDEDEDEGEAKESGDKKAE